MCRRHPPTTCPLLHARRSASAARQYAWTSSLKRLSGCLATTSVFSPINLRLRSKYNAERRFRGSLQAQNSAHRAGRPTGARHDESKAQQALASSVRTACCCPHPEEAPVRRYMFELFAEHQRKKTVAVILNAEGYRTRSGAEFNGITVGRLLAEEAAKGISNMWPSLWCQNNFGSAATKFCKIKKTKLRRDAKFLTSLPVSFTAPAAAKCMCPQTLTSTSAPTAEARCRRDDLESIFLHQLSQWIEQTEKIELQNVTGFWSKSFFRCSTTSRRTDR